MYARRLGGRELTFDFAEGLVDDNLLVVDRETGSVWSQLAGRAIAGEMEGTPLQAVPAMQTTWKFWRGKHPDTRVMVLPDTRGRPYTYQEFVPGTRRRRGGGHDTSALGFGLALGNEAWFFPFRELEALSGPLEMTVAGQSVRVFYDREGLTAWAEDPDGNLLMGVLAYERGWRSFHPDTRVWRSR